MANPFSRRALTASSPPRVPESRRSGAEPVHGRSHLPASPRRSRGPLRAEGKAWRSPLKALTAASRDLKEMLAKRQSSPTRRGGGGDVISDRARQHLAWEMYDTVGELREAARLISDAVAGADLFVGRVHPGERQPSRLDPDDEESADLPMAGEQVEEMLTGLVRAGVMGRLATQLFVSAESFLLGVPSDLSTVQVSSDGTAVGFPDPEDRIIPEGGPGGLGDSALVWHALSFEEITLPGDPARDGKGTRKDDDTIDVMLDGEWVTVLSDGVQGLSLWQAHPQRSDRLDSGVLSALPILMQLVAVGQYAQAAIDSRLTGPGVFTIPQSALGLPPGADRDEVSEALGEFLEDLTEAMVTPVEDRSSPSALVPIVITVPDEITGAFERYEFGVDLSEVVDAREDHLIRRLARALDMPPEQMLGVGDMNHWSAWQVAASTSKAHVEPTLNTICATLTEGILRPTLISKGMAVEEALKWAIGYDVSANVLRPNQSSDAVTAHAAGALSNEALLRHMGFDPEDSPSEQDAWQAAVDTALSMATNAPSLAQAPGIEALARAIYTLAQPPDDLEGGDPDVLEAVADAEVESGGGSDGEGSPVPTVETPTPDTLEDLE